jgi:hypothetical protein
VVAAAVLLPVPVPAPVPVGVADAFDYSLLNFASIGQGNYFDILSEGAIYDTATVVSTGDQTGGGRRGGVNRSYR